MKIKDGIRRRYPNEIGLPSFDIGNKTFSVMVYEKAGWISPQGGWSTVHSNYGHEYSYKGYAINKALGMLRWMKKANVCVINNYTKELVWTSWDDRKSTTR